MFPQVNEDRIAKAYESAKEAYADYGVDTDAVMAALANIPISLHCWQGDDVGGFESTGGGAGGGTLATGNYPGKARTADELRSDFEQALNLIPGTHRINLHAMYAETDGKQVDRNELLPEHYTTWIEWAKKLDLGIDFNPTCFSHPLAESGFTLSSRDEKTRQFWIEHCIACRKIAEQMGKELGKPCITNIWIPDGYKDIPVDRLTPRQLLKDSLDQVLAEEIDTKYNQDSVECKLFGIGSESYVTGSHEFYMGYAIQNKTMLTLDAGHFHPTETISDKLSSILCYINDVLLHVSRGVRWDSDHVVILNDDMRAIAEEIVRNNFEERVHIGLDFFDASINRIGAWVTGTRAAIKGLLIALLEPTAMLREIEVAEDHGCRLALLEDLKTMPFGAVWDYYCMKKGVPVGAAWYNDVKQYEASELSKRS